MVNRLFIPPPNRAIGRDGQPVPGARLYVYQTYTNTQVPVYAKSSLTTQLSQPLVADSDGVFQPMWTSSTALLRLLVTDADDVPLSGYIMDDVVLFPGDNTLASSIGFAPTESVPENDVQSAIEYVAGLSGDQSAIFKRSFTPWATAGTGNDYTITPDPAITAYSLYDVFLVRPNRNNTGPATLNVNGLGTRAIRRTGSASTAVALTAGEIQAGREFLVTYDGGNFRMILGSRNQTGSTGTGEWFRSPDGGMQHCWYTDLTFNFATTQTLTCDWTYPIAFSGFPLITGSMSASGAQFNGVVPGSIGPLQSTAPSGQDTTVARLTLPKVTGAANFVSGNSVGGYRVYAIGRY